MRKVWTDHWAEYLCEAFGLGLFMFSAASFAVLLFHPRSPVPIRIPSMASRGALMGLAMGLTGLVNTYSPWGRRSGAHLNPALSLTFYRLGMLGGADLLGYVTGQFVGGVAGLGVARLAWHSLVRDPSVRFVVTVPGPQGVPAAFLAELCISAGLMMTVLMISNSHRWRRLTGVAAAALVTLYITFESPLSGMSMNPARTVASALWAHEYPALWLYFVAPLAGMLLAADCYLRLRGQARLFCAKLDHDPRFRCIFCESRARD
jgi:aquaporin Z